MDALKDRTVIGAEGLRAGPLGIGDRFIQLLPVGLYSYGAALLAVKLKVADLPGEQRRRGERAGRGVCVRDRAPIEELIAVGIADRMVTSHRFQKRDEVDCKHLWSLRSPS